MDVKIQNDAKAAAKPEKMHKCKHYPREFKQKQHLTRHMK